MSPPPFEIRPVDGASSGRMLAYLEDHLSDNGVDDTPVFQPVSRRNKWIAAEKGPAFRKGLTVRVGDEGWRRAWAATAAEGRIVGHVDLRGHPHPHSAHRALLGMGVDRAFRGQGIGTRLLAYVEDQAVQLGLRWIDLEYLSSNEDAGRLYRRCGYREVGRVEEMFEIDGQSIAYVHLVRNLVTATRS